MSSKQICGVYQIRNIVDNKIYIGSSKDIKQRWAEHISYLRGNIHGNRHLQNAWNKYGEDSFEFTILEKCTLDEQFQREQEYLDQLQPFDDKGYNIIRKISNELVGGVPMIKKCAQCGKEYQTYSNLSKYCNECKEKRQKDSLESFYEARKYWKDELIKTPDVISWGYNGWDDFWESNI